MQSASSTHELKLQFRDRFFERVSKRLSPRLAAPGAPYTYVTTKEFLLEFGLDTLRNLPDFEALEDAGCCRRKNCLPGIFPQVLFDGEEVAEDADIETNCFELVAPVARSQTAEELMASTTGCTSAAPIVVLGRSFSIIDQLEAEGLAVERLAALGVQLPYQVVIAEARFILGDRWHAYGCKPVVQLLKQVFAGTDTQVDAKGPEEAAKFIMSNCKCPLQRSRSCPIMLLAPRG